jgi:hypothetical protein
MTEGSAMIVCQCPRCEKVAQVADQCNGRPVRCPACWQVFVVVRLAEPRPACPPAVSETTPADRSLTSTDFELTAAPPPMPTTDEDVYTDLVPVEDEVIDLEPVRDDADPVDLHPVTDDQDAVTLEPFPEDFHMNAEGD